MLCSWLWKTYLRGAAKAKENGADIAQEPGSDCKHLLERGRKSQWQSHTQYIFENEVMSYDRSYSVGRYG